MSKSEKVLARLHNSLSGVRFEEACKIAESLGFQRRGGQGSYRTYAREDEPYTAEFPKSWRFYQTLPSSATAVDG